MDLMTSALDAMLAVVLDVLPIAAIIFFFQFVVLRRKPAQLHRRLVGLVYVVIGLGLLLIGLNEALFPLGRAMAVQLTAPDVLGSGAGSAGHWADYGWVYAFAAAIGFATTIAEPTLIAVALKAHQVSGGAIGAWGLRLAVAVGVAIGVALGALRIVLGLPLHYFIIAAYAVVLIETVLAQRQFATRTIVPLAYDSGGVTTSEITVPLLAALGLGLAAAIPGRDLLIDGFGLIAFASVFPIITVLAYAEIGTALSRRTRPESAATAPHTTGGSA